MVPAAESFRVPRLCHGWRTAFHNTDPFSALISPPPPWERVAEMPHLGLSTQPSGISAVTAALCNKKLQKPWSLGTSRNG